MAAADLATRAQLEQIATATDRPASARIADLRRERARATDPHVQGTIDTYIGDLELEREADALTGAYEGLIARENAEVRDGLISRGAATGEELDRAGYLSNEELDMRSSDGTLQESVLGAFGAALNPTLLRKLASRRRRSHGQFADEFSKLVPHTRTGRVLKPPKAPHAPGEHTTTAIDVGGDVNKAAELLAQGKHVRLQQPHQVSTLLDRLAAISQEAESKGDKAPNYDLCKVSVPGTNLFCADTKGYGRVEMPQLSGVPTPGSSADDLPRTKRGKVDLAPSFRDHLASHGVRISDETVPASHLRASQRELNGAKVAGIAHAIRDDKFVGSPRLFISNDDYIVDGHHRWAANIGIDVGDNKLGDVNMDVARVDMPIADLIDAANEYTQAAGMPKKSVEQGSGEPGAAEPTRNMFEPQETERPRQNFESKEAMFAAGAEAKPDFDAALTDLAGEIGADVPEFAQAVTNASKRPERPQVILAPIKGEPRASEKIETKYDGDFNKLQDVVRGTVVVPHLRDFPVMIEALRRHADHHGLQIRKAENRYVDGPESHNVGPTSSGYRDAAVALVHPNGTVTELQLQTAPMFAAKEGEGHKLYEQSRGLEADLKRREKESAPASPGTAAQPSKFVAQALARIKELQQLSTALYQSAYEASYA